ncbi:hypothetical protein SAMN02910340_02408 [Methanosarcina thermophila]|uniref:Uncharacterized protein n=1 Tax=Methanosarcina thermophila TaxID=2210 RepID=A0A1I7AX69_METTE|nr:hypothetical protein [Methanosarcina thermophila]ALK06579.1 MAG: hypothetical protein AAY43_03995 [Methanosarcina sp. 795]NLU57821.1 hypothetical protein [Methanosarcina thermophila]SFT79522.1 hypothetical protein SAMN02910340_02408 [Methanosarcina thermophila]HOA69016.1 hypothetical protein [Methanosarcina thermophila]HOQ66474.1 hypothetical protein [Methanosarcina thermophila]
MRAYIFSLTAFLLISSLISAFLAEPCAAALASSNNITLERNGMTWEYHEQIAGNKAILFRNFIDMQAGNNDNFVNAWEIQKAENILRNRAREVLKTKPDVKLNDSSELVKVTDVDFWLSEEALGKVEKNSSITNSALVSYTFEKEVGEGTRVWFMGAPNSSVTITLPAGLKVERIEGLDNKSQNFENNLTVLRGNFSSQKNITLWILDESSKAILEDRKGSAEQSTGKEDQDNKNKTGTAGETVKSWKLFGSSKDNFAWFCSSPKS